MRRNICADPQCPNRSADRDIVRADKVRLMGAAEELDAAWRGPVDKRHAAPAPEPSVQLGELTVV